MIHLEQLSGLDDLFFKRCQQDPEKIAYIAYDRQKKTWQNHSWQALLDQVARWQAALAQEGLSSGDRVGILMRNDPIWVSWDQAALSLGLVTVPLYTDDRPDNIAYILKDANIKVLLVQNETRWQRLAKVLPHELDLKRVILVDSSEVAQKAAAQDDRIRLMNDYLPEQAHFKPRHQADPHALASIVYTSGTTGRPKGVMLSHYNMLSVAYYSALLLHPQPSDIFLSFLPLSHTLERSCGYYLPMMVGASVAYARSITQLAADLKQIRPTVLIAVPRIFERIYERIQKQLADAPAWQRYLFTKAVHIGWQKFLYQQGRRAWSWLFIGHPFLDRWIGAKLRAKLGGRLRIAVSGGAALSQTIARTFIGLGVPIVQGYGLTETSPVISANPLENNRPDSVGVVLEKTEVKIGKNDELLVRGPGVMLGYWHQPEATQSVLDKDGWLHTGDQARMEGQHLFITGRIKDILVLSNGEKIPPADMEMALCLDPLFDQALVIGEGRPYLSALLVLNESEWSKIAEDAVLDSEKNHALVLKRVKQALKDFPGYAKIRRVHLSLDPWQVENGLLTPTLKVKRPQVIKKFQTEIEALYDTNHLGG